MVRRSNLEKLTYAELIRLRTAVDKAITAKRAARAQPLRAKIEALAEAKGFTTEELFGLRRPRRR